MRLAHRVAFELWHGREPGKGKHVMHLCHETLCCNPCHLKEGTPKENEEMKVAAGRQARGERHGVYTKPERVARGPEMQRNRNHARGERNGASKLTEGEVREIRRLYAEGISQRELGRRYGVSHPAIGMIVRREKWSWVT
jgi:hypothetical protein